MSQRALTSWREPRSRAVLPSAAWSGPLKPWVCRVVYAFVPEHPLADTIRERAYKLAEQKLASVEQTMRLEAQEVTDKQQRQADLRQLAETYIERPARLWNEA